MIPSVYALKLVLGVSYGNGFRSVHISDLVMFYRSPIRNGCHGDDTGDLYCSCDKIGTTFYSICKSAIYYTRFMKMERAYNFNNNLIINKTFQVGCDPESKFNFIWIICVTLSMRQQKDPHLIYTYMQPLTLFQISLKVVPELLAMYTT